MHCIILDNPYFWVGNDAEEGREAGGETEERQTGSRNPAPPDRQPGDAQDRKKNQEKIDSQDEPCPTSQCEQLKRQS
jgi:hypothetical protein